MYTHTLNRNEWYSPESGAHECHKHFPQSNKSLFAVFSKW